MSKTLGKPSVTRGRDRGDTLEPIPETVSKPFRKTNLLIIKKLNFNYTKETEERESIGTKEKSRKESVNSSRVEVKKSLVATEKSETNENNKSLLNSLRGNRFNNTINSRLVLSNSIGKTFRKAEKPTEDSVTPKNKIIIEAIPKKEERSHILHNKSKSKKDLVLPSINENKQGQKSDANKEMFNSMNSITTGSKVLKDTLILKKESNKKEESSVNEALGSENPENNTANNTVTGKQLSVSSMNAARKLSKAKTKAKFDYIYNPFREREESLDRYSQVRESFKEKKLHIFNKTDKYFYYVILPGNSSYLVKNCMPHRSNWRECQSPVTTLFNFKWQQNNIALDFASLSKISSIKQIVNHFEYHPVISNKCNLFINLAKYCEAKGLELFKYIPFTVLIQYESLNYTSQMESFTNLFNNIKDYTMDIDQVLKNREMFSETLTSTSMNFTSGNNLNPNNSKLKKYGTLFSFSMGNDKLGNKTTAMINSTHYDGKNYWIVKACDLNRGRCIKMADSLQKIQKLIKKFYEGIGKDYCNEDEEPLKKNEEIKSDEEKKRMLMNKYRTNSVIVQKYLEKPLLYRGRKFDIRIWVMMTHKSQVYVFKEGHLKTSSVAYDINLTNSYVHITNYSIQKYNSDFSKFEYGNEVSFSDFQTYINEEHNNRDYFSSMSSSSYNRERPINVKTDIMDKIKEIIDITFRAVAQKINLNERKNCFEIFGYDFIMDVDYNVFLLEVNTNPGLEESSPLIKKLVPRMLDDALRLTIDDLYETKYTWTTSNINNTNSEKEKEKAENHEKCEKVEDKLKGTKDAHVNIAKEDFKEPHKGETSELNEKLNSTVTGTNNSSGNYNSPFPVDGYSESDNLWDLVCDLNEKDIRDVHNKDNMKKLFRDKSKQRKKSKTK